MDIRNWPVDQIMALPDSCFGRRWLVITSREIAAETVDEWLCESPLPELCVLWSLRVFGHVAAGSIPWIKLALGDHEPASDAEFDAFERIFKGDFDNAAEEGALGFGSAQFPLLKCRLPIEVSGRRFAVQAYNPHASTAMHLTLVFQISSVPKEVPDCLLLGPAKNL